MINFPSSLDSLANPTAWQPRNTPWVEEATVISNLNDAVEALEAKVGINWSTDPTSMDYKVSQVNPLTTKGDIFVRSATGNTRLPVWTDWYMIVADSTQSLGVKYVAPSAGGTVTTTSVASANGLGGTVANATTTPTITLTTNVTGMVKGNWTGFSPATQGTDYYAPSGTDVSVADGGTGVSSLTAFAPIFGGTTWTGSVQSGTVWSAWQVLTSNGTGAIPTMQNAPLPIINVDNQPHYDGNHSWWGSSIYTLTIPAGTIATGRGIKVSWVVTSNVINLGDYRDDNAMRILLWGSYVFDKVLLANRTGASQPTAYNRFELIIKWSSGATQDNTITNVLLHGSSFPTIPTQRNTTSIDTTIPQTLAIQFGFEYNISSVNSKLETIIVEKI